MKRPMGSIGGDDVINKLCVCRIYINIYVYTQICIWCKSTIFF